MKTWTNKKLIEFNYAANLLAVGIFLFLTPIVFAQTENSSEYCVFPDTDAKPKGEASIGSFLLTHAKFIAESSECLDHEGKYYLNIDILADGTVARFDLETVANGQSCITHYKDIDKMEKWIPASSDGIPCRQKLRPKINICLN